MSEDLNPEPEGSAGETAAPVVDPKPEPKPDPKPAKPKGKQISDEEWNELKTLREERAAAEAARVRAEEETAKKRGEFESLLKKRDEAIKAEQARVAEAEKRAKSYAKSKDLATALAGQPLIPKGADQLARLWADQFEVVPDGDGWKTQTIDGKSVEEFVAEALASDEYSHFVTADRRGGTGAKGGAKPAPTGQPGDKPQSLVQAVKAKVEEERAKTPDYYRGNFGRGR